MPKLLAMLAEAVSIDGGTLLLILAALLLVLAIALAIGTRCGRCSTHAPLIRVHSLPATTTLGAPMLA